MITNNRLYGKALRRMSEQIEKAHQTIHGLDQCRFIRFINEHKRQIPVTFMPVKDPTYREYGVTEQIPRLIKQSLGLGWQYAAVEIISDEELMALLAKTERLKNIPYFWIETIPSFTFSVTVNLDESPITLFIGRRLYEGEEVLFVMSCEEREESVYMEFEIYKIDKSEDDFVELKPLLTSVKENQRLLDAVYIGLYLSSRIKRTEREKKEFRGRTIRYVPDTEIRPRSEAVVLDVSPVQWEDIEQQRKEGHEVCLAIYCAAHIRRAHWKRVWCGKMSEMRWREWRWIAPSYISGFYRGK